MNAKQWFNADYMGSSHFLHSDCEALSSRVLESAFTSKTHNCLINLRFRALLLQTKIQFNPIPYLSLAPPMASSLTTPISQSPTLFYKQPIINFKHTHLDFQSRTCSIRLSSSSRMAMAKRVVVVSATTAEKQQKRYPGEAKGFVEEMRFVAMKLHTKDQAREGEKEVKKPEETAVRKWEPTVDGYLKFLVDSKLVYDTLEGIVEEAAVPYYAEFRNTGLERSENLAKDLEWFKEQGYTIPEPSSPGITYASKLKELSVNDPQAFICHFYNIYFAHSAGGRMIGRKVGEKILNNKELEFYKWDGELSQLLQNVREKLNKVAESWTREEKDHCLEETEKSFQHSGEILRQIMT